MLKSCNRVQYAESSSALQRCKLGSSTMPDRTACIHCGKTGFVRREHVIQARKAFTAFYCGACNRSWEIRQEKSEDRIQRPNGAREQSG
jgi:transcription elongation factor Elf1